VTGFIEILHWVRRYYVTRSRC